jgi:protein TonB
LKRPVLYSRTSDSSRYLRRIVAGVGALAVILVLVYALTTGLAGRIIRQLPHLIHAEVVKPPPPKVHRAPPPPKPQLEKPVMPTVPPPRIQLKRPSPPRAITVVKRQVRPPPPPPRVVTRPSPPPPKPAPKPKPLPPMPARPITATHTIPPYPPMARRLGREGRVLLGIVVGADGRVVTAGVVQSSGHSRLDEAARRWVVSHWRYRPATQNGRPVASRTRVEIVFKLSQAR